MHLRPRPHTQLQEQGQGTGGPTAQALKLHGHLALLGNGRGAVERIPTPEEDVAPGKGRDGGRHVGLSTHGRAQLDGFPELDVLAISIQPQVWLGREQEALAEDYPQSLSPSFLRVRLRQKKTAA